MNPEIRRRRAVEKAQWDKENLVHSRCDHCGRSLGLRLKELPPAAARICAWCSYRFSYLASVQCDGCTERLDEPGLCPWCEERFRG